MLNNKIYIGQSNMPSRRWSNHKSQVNKKNLIQYVHRAMAKYGIVNFIFEVIAVCKTQEDADETETQLIIQYDSRNEKKGYNIAPGGNVTWQAGMPPHMYPMYGKKQSAFFKQRMAEVHAELKMPPHTDEWKKNMSDIMTGRIIDNEWREKISKGNLGKKRSKETKSKMSKAKSGIIFSEEHKEKIALANSIYFTDEQILEIKTSNLKVKDLALKYNVSISTIYNLRKK
jgi:group I intron endonuclease